MLTKKLYGIIGVFIILSNRPCQSAEHPFNQVDEDHKKNLVCAGEASRVAYYPYTLSDESGNLRSRGYYCVRYCTEKDGVFSVGFYNDRTNNLIVAHRGTVISEIDNLFADLGILEAAVRENEYRKTNNIRYLTQIPEHSAFTEFSTRHVQRHIATFLGRRVSISSLGGVDSLIVNRVLNFNCLYNSTINAYQTGWGVCGTLFAGIGSVLSAVAPPVGIVMLAAGAVVGGVSGNTKAHSVIDGHLLEGRKTLAKTLDIMYQNTQDIVSDVKNKNPGYENSLTVTGHSLGAAGALGVMARLESEDYPDINSILFNAPGAHNGLIKIWSTCSRLRSIEPVSVDGNADHVKRHSCIVSSLGNDPVRRPYVFSPLPYSGNMGLSGWKQMLIPSHSIDNLVRDMVQ